MSTWTFFIKSQPTQHVGDSVGGKQLHARHTLGHVLLAFPPFKSLLKLFCSLTAVFDYTRIFSPQFLWRGEHWGGLYILVRCWSLHVLGSFSYLRDGSLDYQELSSNHLHSCTQLSVHADAIHAQRIYIYVCACCPLLMLKRQRIYPVSFPPLLSLHHAEKLTMKTWVESLRAAISVLQYKKNPSLLYHKTPFILFCSHQLCRNVIDKMSKDLIDWCKQWNGSSNPEFLLCETRA